MNDPTPTPVPQSLLVTLIESISQLTRQVQALELKVDALASEKRALARDVRCLSDGVTKFREEFEPYLLRAVDAEKVWIDRRRNWVTMIVGAGLLSGCGILVYAVGDYFIGWAAAKLSTLQQAKR